MTLQADRLGFLGLILTAITSPCCFPLFGFLLGAFGLGSFELFGGATMKVFQGFVLLSVIGTYPAYRVHRSIYPLIIASFSALLIFYAYHFIDADYWTILMYLGIAGLMASAALNYYKNKQHRKMAIELRSTITCPVCGHRKEEEMPVNACQYFYECEQCKTRLKPLEGDCCVYCSYGTVKCPPIQQGQHCC